MSKPNLVGVVAVCGGALSVGLALRQAVPNMMSKREVGSLVLVVVIVLLPFVLGFALPGMLSLGSRARAALAATIVAAAVWSALAFQDPGPNGRDGIVFVALPIFQIFMIGTVAAVGALFNNAR